MDWFCRCDYVEATVSVKVFLKKLQEDLLSYLQHDFVASAQSSYFFDLKEKLQDKQFLVSLDFAENYTCQVQDAIQSYHWVNSQVTLHPYVIYYRKNGKLKHENFVVVSEHDKHDAMTVHLFNKKMISFLKTKFGANNVQKVIYFSDGAPTHYKNKSNFTNLMWNKRDFRVSAEWHFFATSHGKGACDGIGGTVKRCARKASLQYEIITTPKHFFDWAEKYFKKISFAYSTSAEHESEVNKLTRRYETAKTVKNTRQYHSFVPQNTKLITCKYFSAATVSDKVAIL